jgi:hypothetical protein
MNFRKGPLFLFPIFLLNLSLPNLSQIEKIPFTLEAVSKVSSLPIVGNFEIFKDEDRTLPTVNFSGGENIFVSIRTKSNGQKEKSLKLLNEKKEEIGSWPLLAKHESGDYFYSLTFSAPATAGIYYLKVKIDSGSGTVFSAERNINVGKNNGNVSISSQSQTVAEASKQTIKTTPGEKQSQIKSEGRQEALLKK